MSLLLFDMNPFMPDVPQKTFDSVDPDQMSK